MFTLFTKARGGKKKRLEIQLKTQPANKACPPKHISFVFKQFFLLLSQKFVEAISKKAYSENAATQSPCQSPGASAAVASYNIYIKL